MDSCFILLWFLVVTDYGVVYLRQRDDDALRLSLIDEKDPEMPNVIWSGGKP
jgi:hypothetical protein